MPAKIPKEVTKLAKEVNSLTKSVKKLKNLEFVQILKNPWKMMWLAFLKGIMVGFGSVLGASVVVAVFIYIIAQLSVVPFVGDFVQDVIREVKTATSEEIVE